MQGTHRTPPYTRGESQLVYARAKRRAPEGRIDAFPEVVARVGASAPAHGHPPRPPRRHRPAAGVVGRLHREPPPTRAANGPDQYRQRHGAVVAPLVGPPALWSRHPVSLLVAPHPRSGLGSARDLAPHRRHLL